MYGHLNKCEAVLRHTAKMGASGKRSALADVTQVIEAEDARIRRAVMRHFVGVFKKQISTENQAKLTAWPTADATDKIKALFWALVEEITDSALE